MTPPTVKGIRKTRRRQGESRRSKHLSQWVARQRRIFLALAGIGASGFSDTSQEHDTYLYEKP